MPLDPLREWQERYSRSGTQLGFRPETNAPFYSSVQSIWNSPRIVRSTLSPGLLFRDRKMMKDGDDNVSLVVSLGRALTINHRKREACLARNEATLFQADAPGSAAAMEPSLGESQLDCVVAARRAAVLDYIGSHFCDPNLCGSSLAEKLGISQRYLQRLLEATGKTFTEHVNELRLDRAFSLLVTMGANKRVSDIALEVGYSDLTTFYTHFKSRFGDTPKGIAGSAPADEPQRH